MIGSPLHPRGFLAVFAAAIGLSTPARAALLARLEQRYALAFAELDASESAAHTGAQALIVHDLADREVPFEHGEGLAAAWPGARLLATDGLGHRRILRDATVLRAVRDFVTAGERSGLDARIARELFDRELRFLRAS